MKYVLRQNIGQIQHIDGVSPIVLDILNKRGIKDVNEFLHPSLSSLKDPFLFRYMKDGINKTRNAINTRPILICGTSEADSVLAVCSLYIALRGLTTQVSFFIVDKKNGIKKEDIRNFSTKIPNALLIMTGCGTDNSEEIALANALSMDVIVIDANKQLKSCPDCITINPNIAGETYPFKDLCSTAVVMKFSQALLGNAVVSKMLDLVTFATISKGVPLISENRAIVSKGLEFINKIKRPGVAALIKQNPISNVTSGDISYRYIPMLDACCALGNPVDIIKLMLSSNDNIAEQYVFKMAELLRQLRDVESNILVKEAKVIEQDNKKIIILYDSSYDLRTLQHVSSKIADKYKKPCVIFTFNNNVNMLVGYCSCIMGINTYSLLNNCKTLDKFTQNGYVEIKQEKLDSFIKEFESICSSIKSDIFEEKMVCDVQLKLSDIDMGFYDSIKMLQPFGLGNPGVKVMLSDISMKNIIIRAGKHFSASIFDETGICDAVCFNSAFPEVKDNIDMVVSVEVNKYRNKEKIQCQILSLMHNGKSLRKPPISLVTTYGVRVFDQPIEVLGLTEKKNKQFINAGIDTVQKLINYLPTKYNDFRYPKTAKDINIAEMGSIIGTVVKVNTTPKVTYAMCKDDNNETFMACWFHQDYVTRLLSYGYKYIFCGKLSRSDRGMAIVHPAYFSSNIEKYKTIIPEYKKITGMSAEYLIQSIDKALQVSPNTDFLERNIVEKFSLMSDYDATMKLHHPSNDFDIRDGQKRKVFNELFEFNFILKARNKTNEASKFLLKKRDKLDELKSLLPYNLTGDQDRCINGLYNYMNSGKILNALVQGDVGSGKTMVALFSMLLAINNCYQTCLIAPTEVLAQQHFTEISGYLGQLGYNVAYLVGGMKVKERKAVLNGLKDGTINAVIGTHAIIQKDVEFAELAVVIIDEQHKFGVAQREKLANIEGPHMISMSATPIPRTLSMATYGENIEVYSIKEKPAGRKDVITLKMYNDNDVNNFMLEQIRQGRQCYVVCPMIDDSEVDALAGVRSVKQEAQAMIDWFKQYPEVKISNATGRMKKELIAEEIDKFTKNETNILISTTIIEVGVNVPNATVMVLKSSERFGLAQAHQLRGRVGRGDFQSFCILQTDMDDPKADILCDTTDGFEIARQDLLLRGSGDYIGTQQTGNNRNVMLMMSEPELYKGISEVNDEIYKDPAKFAKYSYILEKISEDEK